MSWTVKIVNNETGDVVVDCKDSNGIIGVVGSSSGCMVIGHTSCNGVQMMQMLEGLEHVASQMKEDHPELEYIKELYRLKRKFEDLTKEEN